MRAPEDELLAAVEETLPILAAAGEPEASRPPAPGKWSAKQVIGHLVDSAAHNHVRFVNAQLSEDLVFAGYRQEEFVDLQRYQDAPWNELVTLWSAYNRQIARVMAAASPEARMRSRARHNLSAVAWQPVPESQPATLDYFMRDYVGHLKHHLAQVFAALGSPSPNLKA